MRNALGLRVEFLGPHWAGFGSDGQTYSKPSREGKMGACASAFDNELEQFLFHDNNPESEDMPGESCVLLRRTETCIRGFLASVRREAEAGSYLD